MKTMQDIRAELDAQAEVQKALADIRITRVRALIFSLETGNITAREFLRMTDNLWQDEIDQANGRA